MQPGWWKRKTFWVSVAFLVGAVVRAFFPNGEDPVAIGQAIGNLLSDPFAATGALGIAGRDAIQKLIDVLRPANGSQEP